LIIHWIAPFKLFYQDIWSSGALVQSCHIIVSII
jgi:hypothetical protein